MRNLFKAFDSLLLLLVSVTAHGQHSFISVGANLVIPTSSGFKMNAGTGFGASLGGETSFGKHINGIATIEYLSFGEVESSMQTTKVKAIPIQLGIKYYFAPTAYAAKGLFLSGELGLIPTTTKFTYTYGAPEHKRNETGFTLAPGLGYQIGRVEAGFRPLFNLTVSGFDVYYLDFQLAYRFL